VDIALNIDHQPYMKISETQNRRDHASYVE